MIQADNHPRSPPSFLRRGQGEVRKVGGWVPFGAVDLALAKLLLWGDIANIPRNSTGFLGGTSSPNGHQPCRLQDTNIIHNRLQI
jgi:hypothetical protein